MQKKKKNWPFLSITQLRSCSLCCWLCSCHDLPQQTNMNARCRETIGNAHFHPFSFCQAAFFTAIANVSKSSKEPGRPLHVFFFLLQVSFSFSQCSPPVSGLYWYLYMKPKSQQMKIIGMERKEGLCGVFCLFQGLVDVRFVSCTLL